MVPSIRKQPLTVSIVGPGRLGTALAQNLSEAGTRVKFLVLRSSRKPPPHAAQLARRVNARLVGIGDTPLDTHLVWITVPDDSIGAVASQLAPTQAWQGTVVFHSSGALSSDVLSPLRKKGAKVASVHPGMTFARSHPRIIRGIPFGVEGDAEAVILAKRVVAGLGGTSRRIKKENKVLYHTFGTFASPMVVALMATLEAVGKAAGIRNSDLRSMAAPLLRVTLENYLEQGVRPAFGGPLARGDIATVRKHLAALRKLPQVRDVYLALGRVALKELPSENRAGLAKVLVSKATQR